MDSYTYNVRDALNGQKQCCGMIHADSLEDAAVRIMRRYKISVKIKVYAPEHPHMWTEFKMFRNGRQVYLHVTIHFENLSTESQSALTEAGLVTRI